MRLMVSNAFAESKKTRYIIRIQNINRMIHFIENQPYVHIRSTIFFVANTRAYLSWLHQANYRSKENGKFIVSYLAHRFGVFFSFI